MQLKSVRVRNFRSISDSGVIEIDQVTAFVGRNESGKSNLLLALQTLNPVGGLKKLNPIKDFPRHRRIQECTDATPVLETEWTLGDHDRREFAAVYPRAGDVEVVRVCRPYGSTRTVSFVGLSSLALDAKAIASAWRKVKPAVIAAGSTAGEAAKDAMESAIATAEQQVLPPSLNPKGWAEKAKPALSTLRQGMANNQVRLADEDESALDELETLADDLVEDEGQALSARDWVIKQLPIFIYLEEYPEIEGTQDIAVFIQRRQSGPTTADQYFEKLLKVAGLDAQQLSDLNARGEEETRNQLANRAGSVITSEIRRLWKDRPLQIRFNTDGQKISTYVADPNAVYPVEVNLDERSRGFRWFFAFYVTFSADTNGGSAENAVLLLDEPGLYLHALSQSDLLAHLRKDFENQIIYTTHSPFMVATDAIESVRTVDIDQDKGTTISSEISADPKTIFPLQAALGYDLAQSLFIGPANVVIEGVTDFWVLSSVSDHLKEIGRTGLDAKITLTPAGTAQKIPYFVALLTSQRLSVAALFDDEKGARETRKRMLSENLIREDAVVYVSAGFDSPPAECDVEDLLDPGVYDALVRRAYETELKGKTLSLNGNIPRMGKRYETAFEAAKVPFNKSRPLRLFMREMATQPEALVPAASLDRFERLFVAINKASKAARARTAFE